MIEFHSELGILSRAVHYSNLSTAAQNIGLSQPQLSRIVKKLEEGLDVVLLDRSAKRKSGWLAMAFKLAEVYATNQRKLELDIEHLQNERMLTHLRIGTLEGLNLIASDYCRKLFSQAGVVLIELTVLELEELEEQFQKNNLDLMFSFREPGKKKHKYVLPLGTQVLTKVNNGPVWVVSHYEYERNRLGTKRKKHEKLLICNSLMLRKQWIDEGDSRGWALSEVKKSKQQASEDELPVVLMGNDLLSPKEWQTILALK